MDFVRRASVLIAVTLMASSLGGCGSISSFISGSMGDLIPAWAGGLPADAPPRPGTAKYDEWVKHQPLPNSASPDQPAPGAMAPSSVDAVH